MSQVAKLIIQTIENVSPTAHNCIFMQYTNCPSNPRSSQVVSLTWRHKWGYEPYRVYIYGHYDINNDNSRYFPKNMESPLDVKIFQIYRSDYDEKFLLELQFKSAHQLMEVLKYCNNSEAAFNELMSVYPIVGTESFLKSKCMENRLEWESKHNGCVYKPQNQLSAHRNLRKSIMKKANPNSFWSFVDRLIGR